MVYYYLAASLPMIFLDTPPEISYDEFRALCEQHLSQADLAALCTLAPDGSGNSAPGFADEWKAVEIRLRNAVATHRAALLKRDPASYLKEEEGFDAFIEKGVAEAFSRDNPLERELQLDKLRWHHIEKLAGFDPFAGRAILAYALKLRLAERWAAFDSEKGEQNVDRIVNQEPRNQEGEMPWSA